MAEPERTILVIDDEVDVVDLIAYNLEKAGYRCLGAHDGTKGIELAQLEQPDIIVLDLMLPGRDGFQLFEELKADSRSKDIPVIMLTARAEPSDRITGLKLGADDYVTKPFSPKELVLRVQAILKWTPLRSADSALRLGPFHLDRAYLRCYLRGELLNLTTTEFKLLTYLLEHANETMTRDTLLERVWGVTERKRSRTLDTHLMRLREKLGDDGRQIENVRGEGYRFVVENDADGGDTET